MRNGKYRPQGQVVTKANGDSNKRMKAYIGEFSTKEEADEAFIRLAKEDIDKN